MSELLQMQSLGWSPRFASILNRSWRKTESRVRAFSSTSDQYNQSRGGLPRFFSQVLPLSKAHTLSLSLHSIYVSTCHCALKNNSVRREPKNLNWSKIGAETSVRVCFWKPQFQALKHSFSLMAKTRFQTHHNNFFFACFGIGIGTKRSLFD